MSGWRLPIAFVACLVLSACASQDSPDPAIHVAPQTIVSARSGDDQAMSSLRDAASTGSGAAEYAIGLSLAEGWEGPKQVDQALVWWRGAAEHGDADAKNALAVAYAEGLLGQPDIGAARRLWEQAAEQENATAQYNLASLIISRAETKADMATGAEWLRRAAEHGDADAQYFLGNLYYNGEGLPRQQQAAIRLWQQAAAHGHADAAYSLSEAYLRGTAVPHDLAQAEKWMRAAANRGHREATRALAMLATGVVPQTTFVERPAGGLPAQTRVSDDRSEPAIPRFKAPAIVHIEVAQAAAPVAKTKTKKSEARKSERILARQTNSGPSRLRGNTGPSPAHVAVKDTGRSGAKVAALAPAARKSTSLASRASDTRSTDSRSQRTPHAKVAKGAPIPTPRQIAQAAPRPQHDKPARNR